MKRAAELALEGLIRAGCLLGIAGLVVLGWVRERRERTSWGEP